MVHNSVYDSVKTTCQGKIWFFSYCLKFSRSVRLQHSLIINTTESNQSIPYIFCLTFPLSGRKDLRLQLLVGCGEFCISFSQIAGFLDHQYVYKESVNTIYFLHGDNHQHKEGSESTTSGWLLSVMLLVQSNCKIL